MKDARDDPYSPVFDAVDGAVGTEHGVLHFVQHVRVDRLRRQIDLLTFGALGLHVVLPEETLFLTHPTTPTSSTITTLFIATPGICKSINNKKKHFNGNSTHSSSEWTGGGGTGGGGTGGGGTGGGVYLNLNHPSLRSDPNRLQSRILHREKNQRNQGSVCQLFVLFCHSFCFVSFCFVCLYVMEKRKKKEKEKEKKTRKENRMKERKNNRKERERERERERNKNNTSQLDCKQSNTL